MSSWHCCHLKVIHGPGPPCMCSYVSIIFQSLAGSLFAAQGFDELSRLGSCNCMVFNTVFFLLVVTLAVYQEQQHRCLHFITEVLEVSHVTCTDFLIKRISQRLMFPSMHSKQQHSQMQVLNDILICISWHCTLRLPATHKPPASQQSF